MGFGSQGFYLHANGSPLRSNAAFKDLGQNKHDTIYICLTLTGGMRAPLTPPGPGNSELIPPIQIMHPPVTTRSHSHFPASPLTPNTPTDARPNNIQSSAPMDSAGLPQGEGDVRRRTLESDTTTPPRLDFDIWEALAAKGSSCFVTEIHLPTSQRDDDWWIGNVPLSQQGLADAFQVPLLLTNGECQRLALPQGMWPHLNVPRQTRTGHVYLLHINQYDSSHLQILSRPATSLPKCSSRLNTIFHHVVADAHQRRAEARQARRRGRSPMPNRELLRIADWRDVLDATPLPADATLAWQDGSLWNEDEAQCLRDHVDADQDLLVPWAEVRATRRRLRDVRAQLGCERHQSNFFHTLRVHLHANGRHITPSPSDSYRTFPGGRDRSCRSGLHAGLRPAAWDFRH